MMDGLAINAAEDLHAGYPRDAAALIIVELDGPEVKDAPIDRVAGLMRQGRHRSKSANQKKSAIYFGPGAPAVEFRPIICVWMAPFRAAVCRT